MIRDNFFERTSINICSNEVRSPYLFFNASAYPSPLFNISMYFHSNQSWSVIGHYGTNWSYNYPLLDNFLEFNLADSTQFREDKTRCPTECKWFHIKCPDGLEVRDGNVYTVFNQCCKICQGPCYINVRRCDSTSFNVTRMNGSSSIPYVPFDDLYTDDYCSNDEDYYYYQVNCWCKVNKFTVNNYFGRAKKAPVTFTWLDYTSFVFNGILLVVNAYLIMKMISLWWTPLIQYSASFPTLLIVSLE